MHQTLLLTDTPTVTTPFHSDSPSSGGLGSSELQTLGNRLNSLMARLRLPCRRG